MTDIVERLRDQGKDAFAKQYSFGMYRLCDEAAAEIERLRAALAATPLQKSAPVTETTHNSGEGDPSVMPDSIGADTTPAVGGELPAWEDAQVQIVYETVCQTDENVPPNPEEHWEGWMSRRIVAALRAAQPASQAVVGGDVLKEIRRLCDENLGPSRSSLLSRIAHIADTALAAQPASPLHGATHMRRPEYLTAWLFDGMATMPLWLIERFHSLPLPEHRKGCYALAVDGEFWRWMDVARFNELYVSASPPEQPAVQLQARKIGQDEWIDIYPAQVEAMSKAGHNLRAIEQVATSCCDPNCK